MASVDIVFVVSDTGDVVDAAVPNVDNVVDDLENKLWLSMQSSSSSSNMDRKERLGRTSVVDSSCKSSSSNFSFSFCPLPPLCCFNVFRCFLVSVWSSRLSMFFRPFWSKKSWLVPYFVVLVVEFVSSLLAVVKVVVADEVNSGSYGLIINSSRNA